MFILIVISYYQTTRNISSAVWQQINTTKGPELNQYDTCTRIKNHKSEWFINKYKDSINPFWTADNLNVSTEILQWWLKLQSSKPTDLKPLFDKLFHLGVPKYFKGIKSKSKNKCITCAVVGNSVNLQKSRYGKFIDEHDAVIRMNKGPTKGFAEDVGSTTTHRLFYPESAVNLAPDTGLIFLPFKILDIQWLFSALTTGNIAKTYQPVMRQVACNVSNIAILQPEFMSYVAKTLLNLSREQSSTGIVGVALALHICDKVDVYGFGDDAEGGWQHYWEHLPSILSKAHTVTGVHNSKSERDFLSKLNSEGVVTLFL